MSHPGYLHGPLPMFGPENGVCNYLAIEKIYGMSILQIHAFSPAELEGCMLYKGGGGGGGGGVEVTATPRTPLASPLQK